MNKILNFCKNNKTFVVVAIAFVLIEIAFSDKLINISNQAAQVFSPTTVTQSPVTSTPTNPLAYYQYPSLSKSGFYLATKANSAADYAKAVASIQATMAGITGDVRTLLSEYYTSGCSTVTSDDCTKKLGTILNALNTYAAYSVAYNKLNFELTKAPITIASIDYSGIAVEAVNTVLKSTQTTNPANILSVISVNVMKKTIAVFSGNTFNYSAPLTRDTSKALATYLKNNQLSFSTPSTSLISSKDLIKSWQAITTSSDGKKLAAVVKNGSIYTSVDSGISWSSRESNREWSSITSSSDGTKLVATVANGGIYSSVDSGLTWTVQASAGSKDWKTVVSNGTGSRLVAVTTTGSIFTSSNYGGTWTEKATTLNKKWSAVATDSTGVKLVAVASGAVYTSIDAGTTWTLRNTPSTFNTIVTSDATGAKITSFGSASVVSSIDGGVTWKEIFTQAKGSRVKIWQSAASSADGNTIIAAELSNLYISVDGGAICNSVTGGAGIPGTWKSVAISSDGTKYFDAVSGSIIVTNAQQTTSPYLFMFGQEPLGGVSFKIVKSETQSTASSKYGTLSGSTAEIGETKANLEKIELSDTSGELIYAAVEVSLKNGGLQITTVDTAGSEHECGSIPGPSENQDQESPEINQCSIEPLSCSQTSASPSRSRSPSLSPSPTPFSATSTDTNHVGFTAIEDVERKMMALANYKGWENLNIPCPKGESGAIAIEYNDGLVQAQFTAGDLTGVTTRVDLYNAATVGNRSSKNKIKMIYQYHTHDLKTLEANGSICRDKSGNVNYPSVGVSLQDLVSFILFQEDPDKVNIPFTAKVIGSNGRGLAYSISKNGAPVLYPLLKAQIEISQRSGALDYRVRDAILKYGMSSPKVLFDPIIKNYFIGNWACQYSGPDITKKINSLNTYTKWAMDYLRRYGVVLTPFVVR